MAQYAWTPAGRMVDALGVAESDWQTLRAEVRSGELALTCRQCGTMLRPRTPSRARRHFYHPAGAPRSCTNVAGESESDAHRGLKAVLVDAYDSVPGITAAAEQTLRTDAGEVVRVDVLARRGLVPVSAAEVQLSYQAPEEITRRDRQRRSAISVGATDGLARTTPWFSNRYRDAWYDRLGILWLSHDGGQVTDGVYPPHRSGGGDLDYPLALDVDSVASGLVDGGIVQIDDGQAVYWLDRRSITRGAKVRKGRLRVPRTGGGTGPLRPCDREPVAPVRLPAPAITPATDRRPVIAPRGRISGGGRTRSRIGPCEVCGYGILGPPYRHARCAVEADP